MTTTFGNHLSDEALVDLCRRRLPGDTRPFEALVFRYRHKVLSTCYRLLGNRQDAEDQAQEVFIRVYRGLPGFNQQAAFSTWLFQIAINSCRTAMTKRSRQPVSLEEPLLTLEALLPTTASAERIALNRAAGDAAIAALQSLAEDERIVLALRQNDGLSYAEIAEVLGIGLSAAKMRILRARLNWQQVYLDLAGENK